MALEMSFTDQFGEVYPASYWVLTESHVRPLDKRATIVLNCYENKDKLGKRVVATKLYDITPESWDVFFQASGLDLGTIFAPIYQFARLAPEDNSPSFFESASIVD